MEDPIPRRETAVPNDLSAPEYADMIMNRNKYKLSGYDVTYIMARLCGMGDVAACEAFYDWYGISMKKEIDDARKQLDEHPDDVPSQVMWEELTGTIESIKADAPDGITNADRWYLSTKDPRVKTFYVNGEEVPIPARGQAAPSPSKPPETPPEIPPPQPGKSIAPPKATTPPPAPSRLATLKESIKTQVDLVSDEDQVMAILRCINESV